MTAMIVAIVFSAILALTDCEREKASHKVWIANIPHDWTTMANNGTLIQVSPDNINRFTQFCDTKINDVDGFTDGEYVDAIEHFFWGQTNGLAMELGSLDGSQKSRSITVEFEINFEWRRILVEGDPSYRENLIKNSALAFSVNAPICQHHLNVHFIPATYTGGIAEFMSKDFMKTYHPKVFDAGTPPGNVSSIDWTKLPSAVVLHCLPMSAIIDKAGKKHINLFVLDVEGGEMEVLKSIDWLSVKFDVLCIETSPVDRPPGYAELVTAFLAQHGYHNYSGQKGRNIWYTHSSFVPVGRPGIAKECYNGVQHSEEADLSYVQRRRPRYQLCPLKISM